MVTAKMNTLLWILFSIVLMAIHRAASYQVHIYFVISAILPVFIPSFPPVFPGVIYDLVFVSSHQGNVNLLQGLIVKLGDDNKVFLLRSEKRNT